ncbi:MAG: hypothetical protein AB1571_04365 [Nanoarchaeota archaeon]
MKKILSLYLAILLFIPLSVFGQGANVPGGGFAVPGKKLTTGSTAASGVTTDTTNFDGNLSSADNTIQSALETLDELSSNIKLNDSIEWAYNIGSSYSMNDIIEYNNTTYITGSNATYYTSTINLDTQSMVKVDNYIGYKFQKFDNKLYVGSNNSDYSVFDGSSWTRIEEATSGFPSSRSLVDFGIEPTANKLFVALNNGDIYKMTGDNTWALSATPANGYSCKFVNDSTYLYAGCGSYIYKLTNYNNDTWTQVRSVGTYITDLELGDDYFYAILSGGNIYKVPKDGSAQENLTIFSNIDYATTGLSLYYDSAQKMLYAGFSDFVVKINPFAGGYDFASFYPGATYSIVYFDEGVQPANFYKHTNGNIYLASNYGGMGKFVTTGNGSQWQGYNSPAYFVKANVGNIEMFERYIQVEDNATLQFKSPIETYGQYAKLGIAYYNCNVTSSPFTITASGQYWGQYSINATSADRVVNLPAAQAGYTFCFVRTDATANNVYVDTASGDYLDQTNNTRATFPGQYDNMCVWALDSTYWKVTSYEDVIFSAP